MGQRDPFALLSPMPLIAVAPDEAKAANAKAQSDLRWLLGDNEVTEEVQTALYHQGFAKLKIFRGLGEDRAEVRDALKDAIGLNSTDGILQRQQVAAVLAAWDSSRTMIEKDESAKIEARLSKLPRPMSAVDHLAMRQAVEALHGKLQGYEVPSKAYLGTKQQDIDDDEPTAERLSEVTSKDDGEEQFLTADIDLSAGGAVKIKKGARNGHMPNNPEALRAKLKLVGHVWAFLKTRHTTNRWLRDFTPKCFEVYVDFLLGKSVYGLRGAANTEPPWALILNYEYELRKKAYDWVVSEQFTLQDALKTAIKDPELKNLHFLTPWTLKVDLLKKPPAVELADKRERDPTPPKQRDERRKKRRNEGRGRGQGGRGRGGGGGGRGGGGGGGGGSDGGLRVFSKTPDGKTICYKYNNRDETCDGKCQRLHVCQICFENHPRYEHKKKK